MDYFHFQIARVIKWMSFLSETQNNMQLKRLLSLIFPVLFIACSDQKEATLFTLLSPQSTGIKFKNVLKETETFNVLNYGYFYNGGGVAVGDINNDGLPDIYFTGNMVASRLYLNQGNMKFKEISKEAGVSAEGLWNTGVTMADVNADGLLDIYVCRSAAVNFQKRRNLLFINNGDLTFTERANEYGLDDFGYSTQATFFDYDRDGDLDMFLINHSTQQYAGFNKLLTSYKKRVDVNLGDKLFRNDGDFFTEVSRTAGINQNVLGFGLGVAIVDVNTDGWADIYVSNDYNEEDYLYLNQQDGTFKESIRDYFGHVSMFSMGCEAGDFNNDLKPDLITLDMLPEGNYRQKISLGSENHVKYAQLIQSGFHHQTMRNMLQLNNGNGYFSEIGQLAGISKTDWSWAPLLADFDNDGWKDLFVSNGYPRDYLNMDFMNYVANEKISQSQKNKELVVSELLEKMPSIQVSNYFFKNNGDLTFEKKSTEWGLQKDNVSNGAAYADFDNDGDLDLVINNINEVADFYENQSETLTQNHYLKIRLKGNGQNTFGIGANVTLYTSAGTQTQTFYPTRGFQSSVNYELVFGLGQINQVDSLTVVWADQKKQTLKNITADQLLVLQQEDAQKKTSTEELQETLLLKEEKDNLGIDFQHKENYFLDFKRDKLIPRAISDLGPKIIGADVNGDGLEDLYLGGAKNQSGALFFQNAQGAFTESNQEVFVEDAASEDTDGIFFDADQDGDLDLYVVSGGSDFSKEAAPLQDRFYRNDGRGNFQKTNNTLPTMLTSGANVTAADFDQDGDMDLFVGGRLTPNTYPIAPRSYLLQNDGKGNFTDVTEQWASSLFNIGMVTDSEFLDINGDNLPDLIVVGEWMKPTILMNQDGRNLKEQTPSNLEKNSGWWNTIHTADFDQDGDLDIVLGNIGRNNPFQPEIDRPAQLIYKDFDENGAIDPIFSYYLHDEPVFAYSRDELLGQLVSLNKKYSDYNTFATASLSDYFSQDQLLGADTLYAQKFESVYLENNSDGTLEMTDLPIEAQLSPIYAFNSIDVDGDGNLDLLTGGNQSLTRVSLGQHDANYGVVLLGDGKGNFTTLNPQKSGLKIRGDVRSIHTIKVNNKDNVIFGRNNNDLKVFVLEE